MGSFHRSIQISKISIINSAENTFSLLYQRLVSTNVDRKKEKLTHFSTTLKYQVLFGDSLESPIFFLQRFLAVALNRTNAWPRVPPLNHLSSRYTLTNQSGCVTCTEHTPHSHWHIDPEWKFIFFVIIILTKQTILWIVMLNTFLKITYV
jgi:hypothetical protein